MKKFLTLILVAMVSSLQTSALAQDLKNNEQLPEKKKELVFTGLKFSPAGFGIPQLDSKELRKQQIKETGWKCEEIVARKSSFGKWGLPLLLIGIGGAIAGAVIAGTRDTKAPHIPPVGPTRPIKKN